MERLIMSVVTVKRTVVKRAPGRRSTIRGSLGELTRHYFAHESRWQFAVEALLFAIILAISAWPIFAAADALSKFPQGSAS